MSTNKMIKRGKYEIVNLEEIENLRDVWPDEARDFTPWLASEEGRNLLADALEVQKVENPKIEDSPDRSDRRCDIVADIVSDESEDETSIKVVIENQLEKTDFSHLGRLLLYAAGNDAKYIVWVVKTVTEDHRRTIAWLNKNTTADIAFYLLKISAYKMPGDGRCGPLLVPVEIPDKQEKVEKSGTLRQKLNWEFWSGFREFAENDDNRKKLLCIKSLRPGSWDNWYDVAIGTSSCHFALWHSNERADIGIVSTKEAFAKIHAVQSELNNAAGVGEDKITVHSDNVHPVIRYEGPVCRHGKSKEDNPSAYAWLVDRLSALVPIVQKALGV